MMIEVDRRPTLIQGNEIRTALRVEDIFQVWFLSTVLNV